jgi:hypothetical protein
VVGSKRQRTVRGGGPSSGGARGGRLGVARPVVPGVGARGAAAWQRRMVRRARVSGVKKTALNHRQTQQHGTAIACAKRGGRKASGGWSAAAGAVGRQRSGGSCPSGAWSEVSGVGDCSTGLAQFGSQKLLNFSNSNMMPSRNPKISKLGMVLDLIF